MVHVLNGKRLLYNSRRRWQETTVHARKRGTTARTVTLLCRAPCFEKFLTMAAILHALYFDTLNYLHSNSE